MYNKHVNTLTKNNFRQKTATEVSVIDFFAVWCKPCISFASIFEEFATEYQEKANFYKIDVDESQEIAKQYNVLSIPTLIIFKNGEEFARSVGAINQIDFRIWLNKNL